MQARFESALDAAKKGPESFAAEFEKKGTDANVYEYFENGFGNFGDPLINKLIKEIPDAALPAILTILVKHQVNLESRDSLGCTPLANAAGYGKKEADDFLLEQKAEINCTTKPALCTVMTLDRDESLKLNIIKSLLKHGANINIHDEFTQSPLIRAAENNLFEVMRFLISQGANLFSTYTYAQGTEHKTALGVAFEGYISAKGSNGEDSEYAKNAKKCFDFLMVAASDYLYHQGASFRGDDKKLEVYLMKYIDDLAGHFASGPYPEEANSSILKKLLVQRALYPVFARIKEEREERLVFLSGNRLSKNQQEEKEPKPAIYRFFQRTNKHDLMSIIFSYAHETTPYVIKDWSPPKF